MYYYNNTYNIYNYCYSPCTFEITKKYTRTHTLVHFECSFFSLVICK